MIQTLVTGAGGFIGRHLLKCLIEQGVHVRGLVRPGGHRPDQGPGLDIVEGDLQNPEDLKHAAEGNHTIFHLAGKAHALTETYQHQEEYESINVIGTKNLWNGALAGGMKRFVLLSSVKAMGEETTICQNETCTSLPATPYGESKLAAERFVLEEGQRDNIHVTCLRLPLVYGQGNKGNIFHMIKAIDQGWFPPMPRLRNQRSMVHVSNVVQAVLLVSTKPAANGKCYIVTDRHPYSSRELYELICKGLKKRVPRWGVPIPLLKSLGFIGDALGRIRDRRFSFDSDGIHKLISSAWYSSETIIRELGYSPVVGFEDALPGIISWYRQVQE